VLNFLHV